MNTCYKLWQNFMQKDPTNFWLAVPKPHLHWQPKYSSTITHIKYSIIPWNKDRIVNKSHQVCSTLQPFWNNYFWTGRGKTGDPLYHTWHIVNSIILFKDYSTLGVHYRDLQARVHEQETRNLTLHEAECSVKFRVSCSWTSACKPDNARTKSAENVLIFNLSKR